MFKRHSTIQDTGMNMYTEGGVFMAPMTILGLVMIVLAISTLMKAFKGTEDIERNRRMNSIVLQLGVFTFFVGILSQAIGLMQAFQVIQQVGDISPILLAQGLYVSMIAPVYGLIILLVALALWSLGRYRLS